VPAAVAALAKAVGRLSKQPSYQRRLACTVDGNTFLLVIENCRWREPRSIVPFDDADAFACAGVPVALPIESAVQLLQSDDANPEKELARRRAKAAAREAATAERHRKEIEASRAEAERLQKAEEERVSFKAAAWAKLNPLEKFAARLAVAVEKDNPSLAAGIRAAIDAPVSDDAFPRARWFESLPRILEEQRVAAVFETIAPDQRWELKMQFGPSPAAIVKAFEAQRAQKSR
jgi:hypothetical protein